MKKIHSFFLAILLLLLPAAGLSELSDPSNTSISEQNMAAPPRQTPEKRSSAIMPAGPRTADIRRIKFRRIN